MALPVLKLKHIGDSKEGKSSFIHRIRRDDTVYVGATKNAKRRCGEHYRNGYSGSFRYINVADMGKSETFLLDAHVDTTAPTLRFTTENVLGTSALKGPGYIYVINGKKGLPLKELKKQKEADRVKKEAETLAQLAEAQKKIEEAQEQLAAEKAKNAQHVERQKLAKRITAFQNLWHKYGLWKNLKIEYTAEGVQGLFGLSEEERFNAILKRFKELDCADNKHVYCKCKEQAKKLSQV